MATTTAAPPANRPLVRVGAIAAVAAGVVLLTKVILMLATQNTIATSVTGALYIAGMLLPLVAAAGIAASVEGGRGKKLAVWFGVVVAFGLFITTISDVLEGLVTPFSDVDYVVDEVPIGVIGAVWLVVGLRMLRRR